MKLRNKKTGEIVIFGEGIVDLNQIGCKNVAGMIAAGWEDYEEPKDFWYIDDFMIICGTEGEFTDTDVGSFAKKDIKKLKDIGNYFETKEEAEKAVKKLKAWKRLKDKGFGFESWFGGSKDISFWIDAEIDEDIAKDLDILFGGEE